MSREVCTHNLRGNTSGSSLISLSVVLDETKDRKSRVQLTRYISDGMHGHEKSNGCTPVSSARRSSAGENEGSESLSNALLHVDGGTSVSALGLGSGHPLMDLPGNGSTGNLASARHEAGDVIVASAVEMGGRGEGGVHARTGDASGHCEGGADLHEISISSEDSRHEKKSTDDFGDVSCGFERASVKNFFRKGVRRERERVRVDGCSE